MSTHVFKISLCYDNKWDIKLCISVNIYHRLPNFSCFQTMGMSYVSLMFMSTKLAYTMIKIGK